MAKVVQLRNIKRALRLEPCESVTYLVSGRVSRFRTYKSFNFVELIDGSTKDHLQMVVKKDLLKKPELGAYLTCQGNLVPSPGAQQSVEFKVSQLHYASKCDPSKYPLVEASKTQLTDGWYRRNLHLRPQVDHFASLLRVRSELELSLHMIFKQMDFFRVHAPVLTSNDSEASSDLFMVQRSRQISAMNSGNCPGLDEDEVDESNSECRSIEDNDSSDRVQTVDFSSGGNKTCTGAGSKRSYFNKDVFMITSAQLHLESLAASLSRVYSLSPAFRAESSLSRRHLCEFLMLEAEEANVTTLGPLMDRVESIIKFSAQFISEISEFKSDFSSLLDKYSNHQVYQTVAHSNYIRMTYGEAIKVLQNLRSSSTISEGSSVICHHGCDINREHERILLNYCNNVPIFITHYPKHLKPFYMKCTDTETSGKEALCFDLIAPFGGEICGGSLREDDLQILRDNLSNQRQADGNGNSSQMRHSGGNSFEWYLDLREFGSFPHGGFGIGFERLIQALVGVKNIRDTLAFPRWRGYCRM